MELREYTLPLRKWWWLIVAATLIAAVSSYLVTRQQPLIYQSRTTVMVGNAFASPNPNTYYDSYLPQQFAATYADVIQRDNVQQATLTALGLEFLPEYTARALPETQLIEISVTDTDPARAQAVATELVNQLAVLSSAGAGRDNQQRQAFVNAQLDELEAKITETQDQIAEKQTELANLFSARQIDDTQNQIGGLQNKLATLQANYAALLSNTAQGAVNTVNVLEAATLPTEPIGPNKRATVLLAAVIGFVLAAGAAYFLEYLDDTFKNPDDIQKTLGLTTLGAVPAMAGVAPGGELVALASGPSPAAEAYRVLRTNLQFASVDRPLHVLVVTSPAPGEGKSLTAANLGVTLAQAGRRVVLVEGDLHRPRLHHIFGLRNNAGITSALLDEHPSLGGLLQPTATPGLRVLTSGPIPPNPAELLGSNRMRQILTELQADADILIVDSPPVTALADAAILAAQADGVLLVVEVGRTSRDLARRAMTALRQVNARVIGVLLNRMPTRGSGYYYYYSHDGHYDTPAGRRSRKGRWPRKTTNPSQPVESGRAPLPLQSAADDRSQR